MRTQEEPASEASKDRMETEPETGARGDEAVPRFHSTLPHGLAVSGDCWNL